MVHTVFIGSLRYRLPAEYALLVLSAVGGRWLVTKLAASPSKEIGLLSVGWILIHPYQFRVD
jgi:hypothetical protein